MSVRAAQLFLFISLSFLACPPSSPPFSSSAPPSAGLLPLGSCTGGCGPNQKCDVATRTCVDGCGGCDGGICTRLADGTLACRAEVSSCGGQLCLNGQSACVEEKCSCTPFSRTSVDSCSPFGRVCNDVYNAAGPASGVCELPTRYQACRASQCGPGGCAPCPNGSQCTDIGSGLDSICLKTCASDTDCDVGEACDGVCLPSGLFSGRGCAQPAPDAGLLPDGGLPAVAVSVSNACLLTSGANAYQESTPSGNCTYAFFRLSNQELAFPTCRPPGLATLGQACRRDYARGSESLQCALGLECMPTDGLEGVCLRMCNAAVPRAAFAPEPSCLSDEACVNLYRQQDENAVLGVCVKTCDLFSAQGGGCPGWTARAATCVPASADGVQTHTDDGKGLCLPVRSSAAALGQACADTDAFSGATCGPGLSCNVTPHGRRCERPCHLGCAGQNPPPSCALWDHAFCPSGQVCTRTNSSSVATLGFCR